MFSLTSPFLTSSTGEPEPCLTWFKDDKKIRPQEDPRVSLDFDLKDDLNILIIENATQEDAGAYRLEVDNDHGEVNVTVMVSVDESAPKPKEPKIETAPEPVEFIEGDSITLSCKVSGESLFLCFSSISYLGKLVIM